MAEATIMRELPVDLDDEALRAKGEELAIAECKRKEQIDAYLIKARAHRAELKEMGESINKLSQAVKTKKEIRKVECRQTIDERTCVVRTYRIDTNEMVDERALTDDERQRWLPGTEPDGEDAPPSGGGDDGPDEAQGDGTVKTSSGAVKRRRANRETN